MMEGDEVSVGCEGAIKSPSQFEPDDLLGAFASGLAGKGLSPVMVKRILEAEGYFEPQTLTISEWLGFVAQFSQQLVALTRVNARSRKALASSEESGLVARQQPSGADAEAVWQALQNLYRSPAFVRARAKATLAGRFSIIGDVDLRTATQLSYLDAYEDLAKLHHPNLELPSLDHARECLVQSMRKPAHRPSLGKDGERFRTGAVAAAHFFRGTNADPQLAWKWVADRLNSADVPRPRAASFKAKTIENWSSKAMYSESLLCGMQKLAGAKCFAHLTPAQISEVAVITAIVFSERSRKLPN
jgi:hypothetical protein